MTRHYDTSIIFFYTYFRYLYLVFSEKKSAVCAQYYLQCILTYKYKHNTTYHVGICRRREIFIIHSMGSIVKNSSWSWRGCKNEFLSLENRVKVACSKTNRTENPRLSLVVSLLVVSRNSFFSFGNVFSLLYFFCFVFWHKHFQRILIMKYTRRRRLWRVYQTFKN